MKASNLRKLLDSVNDDADILVSATIWSDSVKNWLIVDSPIESIIRVSDENKILLDIGIVKDIEQKD